MWSHVENFSDAALHNDKVGIIDVELNGLEEAKHSLLLDFMPVEDVFGDVWEGNLGAKS